MSEWAHVQLGEVMALDVAVVDVNEESTYPIVGVLNRGRGLLYRDAITGSKTKYKTLNVVRPGQVVYSRLKAFEGAITVVPESLTESYASQEFPTFTCGPDLLPGFFALVTTTTGLWDDLQNLSTGMGGRRERVKPTDFLTARLTLPPLCEQRRIVDVVAAVDVAIEALQNEVVAVGDLRAKLTRGAADAPDQALGSIAVVSQGKGLPKAIQGQQSGTVPWFKIADMTGPSNEFGYQRADTSLAQAEIAALRGVVVPAGSVVFPRVGAAVLTEKKRILDVPGALDENHLILSPNNAGSAEYLLAVMETVRLGDFVQTGAVPSLNMGLVRSIEVPWIDEHADLNLALGSLRQAARARSAELSSLRDFRSTLLSALLSQTISIPESYDVLLDAHPSALEGAPA